MTPAMTPALPNCSPDPSLTPLQHHVLTLLAEGRSVIDAAAEAGVHRNTVHNWRRYVPAFTRETEFAIREQAAVWHHRMVQTAPVASQVLHTVLNDASAPASLRLRAALKVLKAAATPPASILVPEEENVTAVPLCARTNSKNTHNYAQSRTTLRTPKPPASPLPHHSGPKLNRRCTRPYSSSRSPPRGLHDSTCNTGPLDI